MIGRLYGIERTAKQQAAGNRETDIAALQLMRAEHASPLLDEFKQFLDEINPEDFDG